MKAKFASVADLEEKQATFVRLSEHCRGYTAAGDPNAGLIIGDDGVLIVDTLATPVMAARLIAQIRRLTDKPIKHVVLSHYHAVRVLGASAYRAEGLQEVIASQGTYELIAERGAQDMQSEYERFPRLFQAFGSIPGLTWPTLVFKETMTLWMGGLEVRVMHPGADHTRGDTVVWVPSEKVLFSGDLVECDAACYTGDAQLDDWPMTLAALRGLGAEKLLPGRGPALTNLAEVARGLDYATDFVTTLFACARQTVAAGMNLEQAMAHTRRAMDPKFAQVIHRRALPAVRRRAGDRRSQRHPASAALDGRARPGNVARPAVHFHHAQEPDLAELSQRRADPGAQVPLRPCAGQLGSPFGSGLSFRILAQHARRRSLCWPDAIRRADGRCTDPYLRQRRLVA